MKDKTYITDAEYELIRTMPASKETVALVGIIDRLDGLCFDQAEEIETLKINIKNRWLEKERLKNG